VRLLAIVFVLAAAGCPQHEVEAGHCQSDLDCGKFHSCSPAGECKCTSNDGCDATEFCNVAGSCQPKLECESDDDCKTTNGTKAICDTRTSSETAGQCVVLSATKQCLQDSHCPFGFFCQGAVCTPGCKDDGDCPMGGPCLNNQCDPAPGACNERAQCQFGQDCTSNQCVDDPDKNLLCSPCKGDDPNQTTCQPCLIDDSVPSSPCTTDSQCTAVNGYCVKFPCLDDTQCPTGETCQGGDGFITPGSCSGHCGNFFCGNSGCDVQTDNCPYGYDCFQLIVISNQTCTRGGGQCKAGSACSADAPGENVASGACSCLSDADCPTDPNTFQPISCVNPGPQGACVQGTTCGPTAAAFTCRDIKG
jgi:Cys-rich repeat protein